MSIASEMYEECREVHRRMREKGFWAHEAIMFRDAVFGDVEGRVPNPSIYEEKIALMHTEAAEITEARRDHDEALEEEECADLLIRLMDYCGARNFDLGKAYEAKMEKNAGRPYLHGRAR